MKSKKGFTLLEVLLVIDILVIISLITIPIVMSNIESAKKKTFKVDVHSVFRSAEINLRTTVPSEMTCYSLGYADVTHKDKFISGQVCKDSNHNYEVKNLCTKDYCFNGPLETGTQVDSYIDNLPMIKKYEWEPTGEFHESPYKTNIVSVEVLTHKTVPSNVVKSWDVSENGDSSVMAWVVKNSADNTKYDLFIGGEGGVKANYDSGSLFRGLVITTTIDLSNFYTHDTTSLGAMFCENTNLKTLKISNFNTRKVQLMNSLFYGCHSLKTLDISSFETSQVQSMRAMFAYCSSLKVLDLTKFNIVATTEMRYMFKSTPSLHKIYVTRENWVFSPDANTTGMFDDCLAGGVTYN